MRGVHVAIQGVGSVGGGLARHLAADGARLTLADRDHAKAAALAVDLGGQAVDADAIMTVAADVFSPCALGAILTQSSIDALQAPIVAGGANNQLATAADGDSLLARSITYAPDYVINAGGIINVALEYLGQGSRAAVDEKIDGIPERLNRIWEESAATGENAARVADRIAQGLIGR
jgi:leucine dehydrogenase